MMLSLFAVITAVRTSITPMRRNCKRIVMENCGEGVRSPESTRIAKMFRPIVFLRPPAAGVEFRAGYVTNLPPDAVDYLARQFTVRVRNPKGSFYRNWAVKEQAGANLRDIIEVGHHSAGTASLLVLPTNVHCIRTKHPRCNTPVDHPVAYRQGFGKALPQSRYRLRSAAGIASEF
jgi:hypothetical protein